MQTKPVAVYKKETVQSIDGGLVVGERVSVVVVTHPAQRLNGMRVVTTPLVRVGDLGLFETANTTYIPEDQQLLVVQND
jgi:hypothetical protein